MGYRQQHNPDMHSLKFVSTPIHSLNSATQFVYNNF